MSEKQDPAEAKAKELESMAAAAAVLGSLRGALARVRGLIGCEKPTGKIVVLYDDGQYHQRSVFESNRDYWDNLGSEELELSIPILGALETMLREQIRKQEAVLREMGVSDF